MLKRSSQAEPLKGSRRRVSTRIVESIVRRHRGMFDAQNGGFGTPPSSPIPALDLLLRATRDRRVAAETVIVTTLEHMGRGGVYDQIGGGFHRYSVDERWIVPHFEKMSYDNAGLLGNYLRAYRPGKQFFAEIARELFAGWKRCSATGGGGSTPARTPTSTSTTTATTSPGRWTK